MQIAKPYMKETTHFFISYLTFSISCLIHKWTCWMLLCAYWNDDSCGHLHFDGCFSEEIYDWVIFSLGTFPRIFACFTHAAFSINERKQKKMQTKHLHTNSILSFFLSILSPSFTNKRPKNITTMTIVFIGICY